MVELGLRSLYPIDIAQASNCAVNEAAEHGCPRIKIREKELALKRREQNLSTVKFVVGVLLLGALGYALDIEKFRYTQGKDDRTFLSNNQPLLQDKDLRKRLSNIAFLEGINGRKSEYLTAIKRQTQAEIDQAERQIEELKKAEERKKAERQKAAEEKIKQAKEAEKQAKEAADAAKQRAEALRVATRKAYDRALQEAFPNQNLFDLKRRGVQIP